MIVDKVRNATTSSSAVHYELTLRIWPDDLGGLHSAEELLKMVTKAINGISEYEYGKCICKTHGRSDNPKCPQHAS